MRRMLIGVVAGLELTAAVVLAVLAWNLPGGREVTGAVGRVEGVSQKAGKQVRALSRQVRQVHERQPELIALARRLEAQMRVVNADVQSRSINGEGLTTISESLGQVAEGLDGLTNTLAPAGVTQIGKGLTGTADYLEDKVLPAAEKAADSLDKATVGLKADTGKLAGAFKETPLELKSARAMVESLTRFEEGLDRLAKVAKMENFDTMREGFRGMEEALDSGASQVEKLAKHTIPKVEVKGLSLKIEEKDFWPEGKNIAEGMRKGAKGAAAAGKEMEAVGKELPKLRKSLEASHQVVRLSRQALTAALGRQEKIEPLLKRLPEHLVLLAEELPRLTGELSRVLRETGRLKDVARALRQAEKSMSEASANWPKLRKGLMQSADLLRATRKQMQGALKHRDEFERTLHQTVELTTLFSQSLPVVLEEIDAGLERQELSLEELGDSIDQVSEALPEVAESAARLLTTTRLLLGLFAAALALHGLLVWTGSRGSGTVV